MDNHVKCVCFVRLAVGEEAKWYQGLQVNVNCHDNFLFVYCIIKQLLDSVFVISRITNFTLSTLFLSLRPQFLQFFYKQKTYIYI